ncbi:patatin-like phospholipase family protein [Erythrobacteraceae bacterium CFH 75059]|uniref:patatin-like phospholipase family protein n=1 Tax=Qipengyuania thermophila TaxID=2509361 RepID=UPI00102286FD|nr:patatin-like phospholipase family protein [Qipengyuania thermophila]TCD04837.1 patatin-like phospholipase family protein [Erythrobacteraceae bacterium CFH 75059]
MTKPINLALQGGGSHGALAWGVLDRLLEDETLTIAEVSGTSAGAMNAVVLADGWQRGGREGARVALRTFWERVSRAAVYSPIQRSPLDKLLGRYSLDYSPGYLLFEGISRMFSPYQLNPLRLNPLRDLLLDVVDFANVNACRDVVIHVTATHVRTGRARVFSRGEVTCDAVMASACLPQLFPAVTIDGEEYWDGGFSANPAIMPLVRSPASPDIVIVQINPVVRCNPPRTAREILNRVNEISFNTALIKELRTIAVMQDLAKERGGAGEGGRDTYLHLIHADAEVQDLAASSKLNAEWAYLELLFERGRGWADRWLSAHRDSIGQRSSFDLEDFFADPPGV